MPGPSPRSRGPLTRLAERFLHSFSCQVCEGVADLAGRRWMRDFGHYAETRVGVQQWGGRSGRALSTLPAEMPHDDQPLWMLEALSGAVSARPDPTTGDLVVTVDLAAVDFWNAPPAAAGTGQVELEVTLEAGGLKRVWWADDSTTRLLTVLEVGVDVDGLDWTRLPTFSTADA